MREIVLDTETTGLNPADGHRLVEIGAVEIIHQIATGGFFHALINPERDVPEDAMRVHGHTAESLRDKPVFAGVVDDFLVFIGDAPLVIHNAEFDLRFINAELALVGRPPIAVDRIIDTLALRAARNIPDSPTASTRYATATASTGRGESSTGRCSMRKSWSKSICELTGGRQRSLIFVDDEPESSSDLIAFPLWRREARGPRLSGIAPEEAAAHAEHVLALGEAAIWLRYAGNQAER